MVGLLNLRYPFQPYFLFIIITISINDFKHLSELKLHVCLYAWELKKTHFDEGSLSAIFSILLTFSIVLCSSFVLVQGTKPFVVERKFIYVDDCVGSSVLMNSDSEEQTCWHYFEENEIWGSQVFLWILHIFLYLAIVVLISKWDIDIISINIDIEIFLRILSIGIDSYINL